MKTIKESFRQYVDLIITTIALQYKIYIAYIVIYYNIFMWCDRCAEEAKPHKLFFTLVYYNFEALYLKR